MTEPTYSTLMERLWSRLPDVHRREDVPQQWALKRFLSALFDQAGDVEDLINRFDYVALPDVLPGTVNDAPTGEDITLSDLVPDPTAAWSLSGGKWILNTESAGAFVAGTVLLAGGVYEVKLVGDTGPDQGIMGVDLDRQEIGLVDRYSVSPAASVESSVFTVSVTRGYHELRMRWTGTKNVSASNDNANARSFRVVNTSGAGGSTSDLVNPASADDAWLDWLGQLLGVYLAPGLNLIERRDAVQFASSGFKAGTKAAIGDAARSELTGSRLVQVYDHSTDAPDGIGTGNQWEVLIVTRDSETPSGADIVAAVIRKGAKPAGVKLFHRSFEATWDAIEAAYPTWDQWDALTWTELEETGL